MRALCVFCGSNVGSGPAYAATAEALGLALAHRRIRLVFGGGRVGLMGVLADAVLGAGGEAIGVIPTALAEREVAHQGLTALYEVRTMHERKALMADLADGFLALPGGIGTLEELFEVWTWRQIGIHGKPCGILNVSGYFDRLLAFLDLVADQGFLHGGAREALLVADTLDAALDRLAAATRAPAPAALTPAIR